MLQMISKQNKFSFGPSQEDKGQWKTSQRIDGSSLTVSHRCPILAEPKQYRQNQRRAVVGLDEISCPIHTEAAPDGLMQGDEAVQQLYRCLDKLPDEQREVIVLHAQHNVRFKEIAASTGNSINTVQSRYRYGMVKLNTMLESELLK